ncbi:hypothetical protein AVEN_41454-1 [Araneus ventricosus]|uniref:Uncharacterized protein n=1 Tax=Araneus ventricosus TaxID=182803 RepID=A0A4Y2F3J4_ARAVE|nr:hypothetical protein AVEN_41454-1 [Araneus ventricosus]
MIIVVEVASELVKYTHPQKCSANCYSNVLSEFGFSESELEQYFGNIVQPRYANRKLSLNEHNMWGLVRISMNFAPLNPTKLRKLVIFCFASPVLSGYADLKMHSRIC